MKGPFFINFMIIMSCICVCSAVLWNYIYRRSRWLALVVFVAAATVIAGAGLSYYGRVFPAVQGTVEGMLLMYGSLGAISWFFLFFLAFPVLVVASAAVFIERRLRRWKQKRRGVTTMPPVPPEKGQGRGITRRSFLRGVAAVIPVAAAGTSVLGNFIGESYLAVTRHDLHYPDLPDYLDGYKIGQISDVHLGLFVSPERLREALEALAAEGVNRVEITGDLIDELSLLPQCGDVLREMAAKFPDGMDYCYGNHEYYRGLEAITAMLETTPVRILRNSAIEASPGRGRGLAGQFGRDDAPFYIAGTDYSFARGDEAFAAQRREYVETALDGVPESAFVVMLAHHSDFIDEGFERRIPLTMCGHTHGAQFALIGPVVESVGFKYLRGMYRQGRSYGYVNRGTGHWLPFRVFCSREATVFTLHKG